MASLSEEPLLQATLKLKKTHLVFSLNRAIVANATVSEDLDPESFVSGATVSLLPAREKAKKKTKKKEKRKVEAIVFGQWTLALSDAAAHSFKVKRSSREELIEFWRKYFQDRKHVYHFACGNDSKFFESSNGEDMRSDPDLFLQERFGNVSGGHSLDQTSSIFRIVRLCHLNRDTLPATISAFKSRFPQSTTGLKAGEHKAWMKRVGQLFVSEGLKQLSDDLCRLKESAKKSNNERTNDRWTKLIVENDKTLKTSLVLFYKSNNLIPSYRSFESSLAYQAAKEHLRFFGSSPAFFSVARDFPIEMFRYVLKDYRTEWKKSEEMAKDHAANTRDGCIDRILYPSSKYLRKKGQPIYAKNFDLCISNWEFLRSFKEFRSKITPLVIQRMKIYKELSLSKTWRGSTVYEIPLDSRDYFRELERLSPSLDCLLECFFDNKLEGLPKMLEFAKEFLQNQLVVRLKSNHYTLAYDFLNELELSIQLRDIPLYKGLLPACSKICVPNNALTSFLPDAEFNAPAGPVCIAFARRWRVQDLVNTIRSQRLEGKEIVLHVEVDSPGFFHPRDNLQDWCNQLPWQQNCAENPYYYLDKAKDCHEVSFKGVEECDNFPVQNEAQFERDLNGIMELVVKGKCYLLCCLETKRKALLKESLKFRNGGARPVLGRSFPCGETKSYALVATKANELGKEEEDLTIATSRQVSVFGPRKQVYLLGDMWTEASLKVAKHLATEKVSHIVLDDSMLSGKYKSFATNFKKVTYNNNKNNKPRTGAYRVGAFYDIARFLTDCLSSSKYLDQAALKREELGEEVRAKEVRAKHVQKLKIVSKQQQAKRDQERERREEQAPAKKRKLSKPFWDCPSNRGLAEERSEEFCSTLPQWESMDEQEKMCLEDALAGDEEVIRACDKWDTEEEGDILRAIKLAYEAYTAKEVEAPGGVVLEKVCI